MGTDEAPDVEDDGAYVRRLPVARTHDLPVAPRFQHRVKQVHVFRRERLGHGRFGPPAREDGEVRHVDGGDRVEGKALPQALGVVQPAVLYSGAEL